MKILITKENGGRHISAIEEAGRPFTVSRPPGILLFIDDK
jgi:hypothetical protein